jgi:hypothetical protein
MLTVNVTARWVGSHIVQPNTLITAAVQADPRLYVVEPFDQIVHLSVEAARLRSILMFRQAVLAFM